MGLCFDPFGIKWSLFSEVLKKFCFHEKNMQASRNQGRVGRLTAIGGNKGCGEACAACGELGLLNGYFE